MNPYSTPLVSLVRVQLLSSLETAVRSAPCHRYSVWCGWVQVDLSPHWFDSLLSDTSCHHRQSNNKSGEI